MIETFTDFAQFKKKAQELGVGVNLDELLAIDITFLESYEDYVIINVKIAGENPNNILVLSSRDALLYSNKTFGEKDYKMYRYTLEKDFGEATVLAFLTLRSVLDEYLASFKVLDDKIDSLETAYDPNAAEESTMKLRRLTNRVEDFVNLLISLEERKIKQVSTNLVGYDYGLVLAKAQHLLDRCRNHLSQLRDIRSEIEVKGTSNLSKNIEKLTVIMAVLTVFSVVISIPNTVATIFGIPHVSEVMEIQTTVIVLAASTFLALLWGVHYWRRNFGKRVRDLIRVKL
ncbi:MAG TPA: CorA family divalent cation transporter [Candidatus Norongarragalinales archaeon]|nr:CorA family divalent cation transporter [Candidatus Norongarragalinales archaeon]